MRASCLFQMRCPRCFTPITRVLNHECQRLYPSPKPEIESNLTYIESIGNFDDIDVYIYYSNTTTKLFGYKVNPNDKSTAILISPDGKEYRTLEELRADGITGFDTVVKIFTAI